MKKTYWLAIPLLCLLSGCLFSSQAVKKETADSKIDSKLTQTSLAAPSENINPGNPQKGFDQEASGAQSR